MKATELRIGNIINKNGLGEVIELREHVVKVRYKSDKVRTALVPYEDIEPVTLTGELLAQCGFAKHAFYDRIRGGSFDTYVKPYFKIAYNGEEFIPCRFYDSITLSVYGNGVKYLHQLQNLYFALTGEELSINI